MGGYAAFELARRHPAKLAGLLLADTRPGADSAEQRAARDANIELVRREGAAALWRKARPSLLRPAAEADVVERARAICERQPPERLVAMLEALRDRADRSDVLAAIAVPTVVVCGSDDALTPPAESRAWAQRIGGARYVELSAAGHLSVLEQPAGFRAALALLADA
jgi:pimeloyl-ACP methyl ester carboxylesterase